MRIFRQMRSCGSSLRRKRYEWSFFIKHTLTLIKGARRDGGGVLQISGGGCWGGCYNWFTRCWFDFISMSFCRLCECRPDPRGCCEDDTGRLRFCLLPCGGPALTQLGPGALAE